MSVHCHGTRTRTCCAPAAGVHSERDSTCRWPVLWPEPGLDKEVRTGLRLKRSDGGYATDSSPHMHSAAQAEGLRALTSIATREDSYAVHPGHRDHLGGLPRTFGSPDPDVAVLLEAWQATPGALSEHYDIPRVTSDDRSAPALIALTVWVLLGGGQ